MGAYDDILHLPHPVSKTRPQMPMEKRAAQFSSFAALTGYEDGISEAARLTDRRIALDEDDVAALDRKLRLLVGHVMEQPKVVVTYFQPDGRKDGGAYISLMGRIKKIDEYEKTVVFMDNKRIAVEDILEIECELFKMLD